MDGARGLDNSLLRPPPRRHRLAVLGTGVSHSYGVSIEHGRLCLSSGL